MSIEFGTYRPDGSFQHIRTLDAEAIADCPFYIMVPDHYREDGSCKCNDPEEQERMIREDGYSREDFVGAEFTAESCCGNCGDSNCGCF